MRTLFVPNYSQGNPYLKLLSDSLTAEGWDVSMGGIQKAFNKKFDVVHIHWPHAIFISKNIILTLLKSVLSITGLLFLKLSGTRIIWTTHNIISHERRFEVVERCFTCILAKICDGFISHSQYVKEQIVKLFNISPEKVAVIPHGNYIHWYENKTDRSAARRSLHYDDDDIVFALIGVIRFYKGIPALLASFQNLLDNRAKLLIAGRPFDNNIETELRALCLKDNRVNVYLEYIPDNMMQMYMNAVDAIVLPYSDITTSGALLLAMSFGKAIIAPELPFMIEMVDEQGAILYNSNNYGLLKALETAIMRRADLQRMGHHNYTKACMISWKEIGTMTVEVYKQDKHAPRYF